jgi:hypothetical protein
MQRFAKELVALQPDVILSHITPTTAALLQQTRTIPIVFATVSDPVGSGFVASFPQPGDNVTGFTSTPAEGTSRFGVTCSDFLNSADPEGLISWTVRHKHSGHLS